VNAAVRLVIEDPDGRESGPLINADRSFVERGHREAEPSRLEPLLCKRDPCLDELTA